MDILIRKDLYRLMPGPFNFKKLILGFRSKGFRYLFIIRLLNINNYRIISFPLRFLLRFYTYKYGFQIPYYTKIGGGLFIGHFGTIVISANAKIGENCNIAHNVTIGTGRGKRHGAPTIGSKVWIGAGAVLTGNIVIGDNVLIAPNAFVNIDIPSNSIALGNPAKIIPKEDPTCDYINNVLEEN